MFNFSSIPEAIRGMLIDELILFNALIAKPDFVPSWSIEVNKTISASETHSKRFSSVGTF